MGNFFVLIVSFAIGFGANVLFFKWITSCCLQSVGGLLILFIAITWGWKLCVVEE
jgi:hypothetical protein